MEWAGVAMLLPSGHPIHFFINDGMGLCVWLQIRQVPALRSICCRVLLLFLCFYFFLQCYVLVLALGLKNVPLDNGDSCNDEQYDGSHTVKEHRLT